ncbi:rhodanese-like domain-containing protein [Actinacidiphila glaucinigra]
MTTMTTMTTMTSKTTMTTQTAATSAPAGHPVLRVPPAAPADAAAYFAASLAFHTDVSDIAAALATAAETGAGPGFAVVDSRSTRAWEQGHVPGAVHLPTADVPRLAGALLDRDVPVVVYCWGPGCNGATRAALALASAGYQVKEMLGGMEYWIREGFAHETADGTERRLADPLTAPVGADDCGC